MHRIARLVLRAAVLLAVVVVLSSVMAVHPGRSSPYASSLSPFAPAEALAATKCPDRACPVGGPCFASPGSRCFKSGGQCFSRGC